MKKALLILVTALTINVNAQIITTVAGGGNCGSTSCGDGGQATAAELFYTTSVTFDASGNLYMPDLYGEQIRKVATTGIITTIVGTTAGYSGDGGIATNAEIFYPEGITFDASGNLYIADSDNNRIRKVTTAGIISTFAGNGTGNYNGDGGNATAAELSDPFGVAFDAAGNLYIADQSNNVIRKINTAGIITTVVGTGSCCANLGDGGQATLAELNQPWGLTFDTGGNLYISDWGNNRIRMVNSAGIIVTIAGTGTSGYSGDGGLATAAELHGPTGIGLDALGNLYMADYFNARVRKVTTTGIISTIAGDGSGGFSGDGGNATSAELQWPIGVTCDTKGNLYIADYGNSRIRKVTNVAETTDIETFNTQQAVFQVYPNPASTSLQVSLAGNSESGTLVITDMLGNTVKQLSVNSNQLSINIADIEAGVYFITLTSGAGVSTQKVVVSK